MVEAHLHDDLKEYVDPDILATVPRETIMRLPKIVEHLGTGNYREVAEKIGVSYWTFCNDLKYLKQTGWYDTFILGNFIKAKRNLPDTDEAKLVEFREMSKLLGKVITTKPDKKIGIEIGEQDGNQTIRVLADYRDVFISLSKPDSFRRVVSNNHTVKQVDTEEPTSPTEAS